MDFLGHYARIFEEMGNSAFCFLPVFQLEMSLCSTGFNGQSRASQTAHC